MRWNEEGLFSCLQCGKRHNPWENSRDQGGHSEGSGGYWWDQLSWRNLECRGWRKFWSYSCSLLDCVPGLGKPGSYPHTVKTCWLWCKWGRWRTGLEKRLQKPNIQLAANKTVGASYPHPVEYPQGHPSPTSPPLPFSTSPGVLDWGVGHIAPSHFLRDGSLSFVSAGTGGSSHCSEQGRWWLEVYAMYSSLYSCSQKWFSERFNQIGRTKWVFKKIIFHEFQCVQSRLQIQALSLSFWSAFWQSLAPWTLASGKGCFHMWPPNHLDQDFWSAASFHLFGRFLMEWRECERIVLWLTQVSGPDKKMSISVWLDCLQIA